MQFRLDLKKSLECPPSELLFLDYLSRKERKEMRRKGLPVHLQGVSGEFRVKSRMDERLMNALRSLHFKSKGQQLSVSQTMNLKIELSCLVVYQGIFQHFTEVYAESTQDGMLGTFERGQLLICL